ncbi:MAG: DUF3810 domain-containing protein, partial [Eubacteriales bacterium]|nr:DUF3810 domain-containing protein [Eubacteriales bacterium]
MAKMEKTKNARTGFLAIALRFAAAAALIILGLSWPRLLAGQSAWIEQHYSEGIYQPIRRAISAVTSVVPFSIAEFVLYGLIVGAAVLILTRLMQLLFRKIRFSRLVGSIVSILLTGGIILNLFYVTWGFNYFREPLAQRMGLSVSARSVDELEAFVLRTAAEAQLLRETLHENEDGVFAPKENKGVLFAGLSQAYAVLAEQFTVFQSDPTRAKQILWSTGLSWQGISGIYIGLTAEPNVNATQPPLLLYQAAAHEMAHQTGIASENEAEFVGYLACLRSNDANVRYSGLAYALIVSGNALFDADITRYLAATELYGDAIWR